MKINKEKLKKVFKAFWIMMLRNLMSILFYGTLATVCLGFVVVGLYLFIAKQNPKGLWGLFFIPLTGFFLGTVFQSIELNYVLFRSEV